MWAQRNKLNKKGTEFWVRELEKASMKKKMNRSQDSKEKECKALWLSGEMISEVKDKINVKNLRKKTCEAQQEAGVPGMDDSSLRIASFAFMTTGPLQDDMQPSN